MIRAALDAISLWAIPVMLVGIPFVGLLRKVKVYDVFIEGATEGFDVAVRIIPSHSVMMPTSPMAICTAVDADSIAPRVTPSTVPLNAATTRAMAISPNQM